MNTTKMLKDLLERVESGKAVITNLDVSNETKELEPENGWANFELTGEQTFYITTKPGAKKSAPNVDKLFGSSVSKFGEVAAKLRSDNLVTQTFDLFTAFEKGFIDEQAFERRAKMLCDELRGVQAKLDANGSHFARVNDMLGRLNRALGNLGNNLTEQTEEPK
jgi:hypothetical protein